MRLLNNSVLVIWKWDWEYESSATDHDSEGDGDLDDQGDDDIPECDQDDRDTNVRRVTDSVHTVTSKCIGSVRDVGCQEALRIA